MRTHPTPTSNFIVMPAQAGIQSEHSEGGKVALDASLRWHDGNVALAVRSDEIRGEVGYDFYQRLERRRFRIEARYIRGLDVPDAFAFVVTNRDRELHGENMALAPTTVQTVSAG